MRYGILGAAVAACALISTTTAETITISGSSTVKPIVEKAAKAFESAHPGTSIQVGGGGSSSGVKAVSEGKVSIGMASRALKEKETAAHPELRPIAIGLDGVALFVHESNPLAALSADQVRGIFAGSITDWSELGGTAGPIALVCKTDEHGTHEVFCTYFGFEFEQTGKGRTARTTFRTEGTDAWGPQAIATNKHRETLAAVITDKNAIGYAPVGTIETMVSKGAKIKALALEGVEARSANVANGTYPLCRPLNIVTLGTPSGMTAEFIAYLQSRETQQIVASLDFVPMTSEQRAAVSDD